MTDEPRFGAEPVQDLGKMVAQQSRLWLALAENAADIAHAKRTMFQAFVNEGFSEPQALELIKGFS